MAAEANYKHPTVFENINNSKLLKVINLKTNNHFLRVSILVLSLSLSGLPVAFAATETDTPAENTIENTADNVQETTQGFDDWGLLGLLGFLGLLGLRGNRNVVVDGTRK